MADGLACLGMGAGLVGFVPTLATLTDLAPSFLRGAGLLLLPIGAFILWLASRRDVSGPGVMAVVVGNAAWVAASFGLLAAGLVQPNGLGTALIVGQALAVALIAALEHVHRPRPSDAAA
jgi:hypothetical protein